MTALTAFRARHNASAVAAGLADGNVTLLLVHHTVERWGYTHLIMAQAYVCHSQC